MGNARHTAADNAPHKNKKSNRGEALKAEPIFSTAKSGLYGIWVFTLFWNAVCWPVLLTLSPLLLAQFQQGDWLPLVSLIFPLIGFVALGIALKRLIEWQRFGATPLYLNPYPGSIGGNVAGSIALPGSIPKDIRYDVSLVCVYTYETRTADNKRSSAERMIWQHSQAGQLRRGMDSMNLLFRFDVPEGLPRSESKSGNYHHWRVHVYAEMESGDLDRSFDIPVHPTKEQSSIGLQNTIRKNSQNRVDLLAGLMKVEVAADTLHLCFPGGRSKSTGLLVGMLGIILMGGGFAVLKLFGGEQGQFMGSFIGLMLLLVSLPAVLLSVYISGNRLDVKVMKDAIVVRRSIFGVGLYRKKIALSRLKRIKLEEGRRPLETKPNVYYKVIAVGPGGEKLVLAEGLRGKSLAEEALRFIRANGNLVI